MEFKLNGVFYTEKKNWLYCIGPHKEDFKVHNSKYEKVMDHSTTNDIAKIVNPLTILRKFLLFFIMSI